MQTCAKTLKHVSKWHKHLTNGLNMWEMTWRFGKWLKYLGNGQIYGSWRKYLRNDISLLKMI